MLKLEGIKKSYGRERAQLSKQMQFGPLPCSSPPGYAPGRAVKWNGYGAQGENAP
jgi:hypothetical protein